MTPEIVPAVSVETKIVLNATAKIKKLKADREKSDTTSDALSTAINDVTAAVSEASTLSVKELRNTTSGALNDLKDEIYLLPLTLENLPAALKTSAAENIENLKKGSTSLWKNMGGEKALNFARTTVGAAMEMSGMNKALTWMGDTMGKIGEWANGIWEHLKPTLGKMADNPAILWMLGPENAKKFQEYMGYDSDMVDIKKSFSERLKPNISFTITTKQEVTAFKDLYVKMLGKNGKSKETYSRDQFVADLLETSDLKKYKSETQNVELQMSAAIPIIKKFVDATNQVPPATTPATPPAAPAQTPPAAPKT